jgi:hypothetical protein
MYMDTGISGRSMIYEMEGVFPNHITVYYGLGTLSLSLMSLDHPNSKVTACRRMSGVRINEDLPYIRYGFIRLRWWF